MDRLNPSPSALGLTPSNPWDRGRVAYLFYDRVERTARAADVAIGCLLNHAFAHEIVHVLLP